jgi:hypothetical protein
MALSMGDKSVMSEPDNIRSVKSSTRIMDTMENDELTIWAMEAGRKIRAAREALGWSAEYIRRRTTFMLDSLTT